MGDVKKRELALGAVMLGAGVLYLLLTFNLPRRGFVDAAFVPYVLGFAMCVLGAMQLAAANGMAAAAPRHGDAQAEHIDYPTVVKTVALIVAYVALLGYVGFPIVTAIYLYVQFLVLTPADRKVNHVSYAAIAIISAAVIYITFRFGFDLMLPAGFLD